MSISGYYLGLFPTPGGDKYHLFDFGDNTCTVLGGPAPTVLENLKMDENSFSGDMPAGMTTHHFEGRLKDGSLNVLAKVIDNANGTVVNTYGGLMVEAETNELPENPAPPEGPGGGPVGRPRMPIMFDDDFPMRG